MKLGQIVLRIRSKNTYFGNYVGGAVELEIALKNTLKRIQKTPDKNFKSSNPATEKKVSDRTGFTHQERKTTPVKGSLGKKTYKSDITKYHRAHQRMGLTKD